MHFSIDRTVHTTAFDKPVVDHWLERKIMYDVCMIYICMYDLCIYVCKEAMKQGNVLFNDALNT